MNDVIYNKTQRGQEVVSQRSLRLSARQRTLLIVVDGKKTLGELRARMGDVDADLQELVRAGLIEYPAAAAAVVPTAAPAPAPSTRRRSVALARLYLLEMMERILGANSGPARDLLRACTCERTLRSAFPQCAEWISARSGEEVLERVEREFFDLLPGEP